MVREFAVSIYLVVFSILFQFFKLFSVKEKTTFVASFGGNIKATLKELEKQRNEQVVILITENCQAKFKFRENRILLDFRIKNPLTFIKSVYHLATSSHVFVDNYYGFLAVTPFKKDVKCVQLWHAAGAIKQFGLQDLSNRNRSNRAIKRFKSVYNRFDHVIVGSDKMIQIFKDSFDIPESRFLRTGIPRTDFFFDDIKQRRAANKLRDEYPIIEDKKVILYAPTYRDGELNSTDLHIDLSKMYEQFKYEYVLFLRLHPAVNGTFENKYPGFIYNVSHYETINDLLIGADLLITDYSSIPFEFSLLGKPMIFYAYDLDSYAEDRGVWSDYKEQVPGPVVHTTKELIKVMDTGNFQIEKVPAFAEKWNKYSNGNAAENLIKVLYDQDTIRQDEKILKHV